MNTDESEECLCNRARLFLPVNEIVTGNNYKVVPPRETSGHHHILLLKHTHTC